MTETENKLIQNSIKEDVDSFEQLISGYEKKVYNIAYRMMGNREDAMDMAQETFIKVFRTLKGFKGQSSLSTWIYRVATNVCIDELRRRKKMSFFSLDAMKENTNTALKQEINSKTPQDELDISETKREIVNAINTLPEQYKSMVVLKDIQGFSYEEISRILNCPMGTVKSRLSRARNLLRRYFLNGEQTDNQMRLFKSGRDKHEMR